MNTDDFRYMRRGKQILDLKQEESSLLEPVDSRSNRHEHALLLLHGFSSSPAVYRLLLPKIKHYDAIICPVLPGHGKSIEAFSQATVESWRTATQTACAELTQKYSKVDVLGLSLGGLLACELSQHFALNHLYLLAPALKLHMRVNWMLKLAQTLHALGFSEVRNAAGSLSTNENGEIAYRKLPVSTVIEMLTLAKEFKWVPPTCPVDLFLGTHDDVVASAQVEQLFIDLPNATIHWLKNSSHVLPLDNDIEEIAQCINKK